MTSKPHSINFGCDAQRTQIELTYLRDQILPRSAVVIDGVAVVDEQLVPFGNGLEGPDAAGVAEPGVGHEAELAVPGILERIVDLVAQRCPVTQNAGKLECSQGSVGSL